jgi:DNA-binding response OmpR family regulator
VDAADGVTALAVFEREEPDLVILDVNLPRLSGLEVCRKVRAASKIPIMMLTVRSAEEDQVEVLDLGADDYLSKPFSPRTLLARVRALLRRTAAGGDRPVPLATGDFILDTECQTVSVGGREPVRLTKLEFRLLQLLFANAGHTSHRAPPAPRLGATASRTTASSRSSSSTACA